MATIGDLVVNLRANTGQFAGKMKGSRNQLTQFGQAVAPVASSLAAAGPLAAALAVTVAGFVAVKKAASTAIAEIEAAFDRLDTLAKTGARLGVPTENLAGLRHAAELSGASIKELDTGLQNLTRRTAEAAEGTGEGVDALKKLGIEAKRLNELSPDQQFLRIAEAMAQIENQNSKVAIAFDLFGRSGVKLLNAMDGGVGNLIASMEEAKRLGIAPTADELARIEAANDAISKIGKAWDGVFNTLAIDIAPVLVVLADEVAIWGQGVVVLVKQIDDVARAIKELPSIPVAGKFSGGLRLIQEIAGGVTDINDAFDEARKNAEAGRKATEGMEAALAKIEAEAKALSKLESFASGIKESLLTPLDKFIRDSEKLAESLGKGFLDKSQAEQALANLVKRFDAEAGVTAEKERQLKLAAAAVKAQQSAFDRLRDSAKRIFDETRNPFEKFRIEVEKLKKLRGLNLIDPETFARKVRQLREQTSQESDSVERFSPGSAGARAGTQEFFDAVLRATTKSNSPEERTAKAVEKTNTQLAKHKRVLDRIQDNTGRQPLLKRSSL